MDLTGPEYFAELYQNGICRIPDPFSRETINRWNRVLDAEFLRYGDAPNGQIPFERLDEIGLFREFLNENMRRLVYRAMPDAVIHEFSVQENGGSQEKSFFFGDRLHGWHQNILPLPGLDLRLPHYLHLFVYLTDVGPGDGAFEFLPLISSNEIKSGMISTQVHGERGTAFLWNRAYYHRASPNTGSKRRRTLRFLFEHNYLANVVVEDNRLDAIKKRHEDDEFISYLLGKYHAMAQQGRHFLPPYPLPIGEIFKFSANARVENFSRTDQLRLWAKKLLKIGAGAG